MASNSVSEALLLIGGERVAPNHSSFESSELTVCVIRDPIEVLESWWAKSGYDQEEQFINDYTHSYFAPGGRLYYLANQSDILLPYSKLEKYLEALLKLLWLPTVQLTRTNVSPKIKKLNDATIQLARKRFPRDFSLWESLYQKGTI